MVQFLEFCSRLTPQNLMPLIKMKMKLMLRCAKMFKIWRNENGLNASRRLILETLQKRTIERNDIVHEYMQALKTKMSV